MHNVVICGFPGVGKSRLAKQQGFHDVNSYVYRKSGRFPEAFIEAVAGLDGTVLLSSHRYVRNALHEAGIPFFLAYPHRDALPDYIQRLQVLGASRHFINSMEMNWDNWIDDLKTEDRAAGHVRLGHNQYLDKLDVEFFASLEREPIQMPYILP